MIQFLIIFFQACIAGILFGQMVHLLNYQSPDPAMVYVFAGLVFIMGLLLSVYIKQIQRYLFYTSSFNWIHFYAVILYGGSLLLMLFPVFISFEESSWMVYTAQGSTLLVLFLVITENYFLHFDLLQKIYADLLRAKRPGTLKMNLAWLIPFGIFAVLSLYLHDLEENTLQGIFRNSLIVGAPVFCLLIGAKAVMKNVLGSLGEQDKKISGDDELEKSPDFTLQKNYYFLENNLKAILLEIDSEDRSIIYGMIRQIPLIDKIGELESIQQNFLQHDQDLVYTLDFLRDLSQKILGKEMHFDVDTVSNIPEVKAYVRTVILEGNSMPVQKLLNDNRPEVKKAAIYATAYFKEPGFIPTLVNFLKEHEFAFAAKEALFKIGDQCLPYLRSAKYRNKDNSFFIEQCLQLVKRYKSNEAREFLIEMLNEPKKRFQYRAALALLENGYSLSVIQKTQILHFIESLIATIAIEREIYCKIKEANAHMIGALLEEEKEKMLMVMDLLKAFLNKPILRLVKDLYGKGSDKKSFTLFALIDLHFPLVLRNKCKILLGSENIENIAPKLQIEYINDQIHFNYASQSEAFRQILKMDYSQIGYWLRVCTLKQLAEIPNQQVSLLILAEVFNKNPLLQEVACEVLYDLNYDYYVLQMQRLSSERAKVLRHKIEKHKMVDKKEADPGSDLLYHQILYLRTIPLFKGCSYESLARNAGLFTLISFSETEKKLNFDPYKSNGYWIVYQGEFTILHNGEELFHARKGEVIDMSFLAEAEERTVTIQPKGKIKIYFVEFYSFSKLYLKSRNSNSYISQPKLEQSVRRKVAA